MGGNPAASHFRELQSRQRKRPSPSLEETSISPSQIQSYRNLMLYSGRHPIDEGDIDLGTQDDQIVPEVSSSSGSIGPLSDDDLQALLILLEQYKLQGKSPSGRNFYTPPAQYFTPTMDMASPRKRETGKRETGKRTAKVKGALMMEQPMSFENSLGGDTYPVFLSQKRSKRVGHVPMQMVNTTFFLILTFLLITFWLKMGDALYTFISFIFINFIVQNRPMLNVTHYVIHIFFACHFIQLARQETTYKIQKTDWTWNRFRFKQVFRSGKH